MPSRLATAVTVSVNGAPLPAGRVLSVRRSTGSGSKDEATFRLDMSEKGTGAEWIQNLAMNGQLGALVTVEAFPGGIPQLLHSGIALVAGVKIGEHEQLTVTSRVEPWMFGSPLSGYLSWDPLSGTVITVLDELLFNPEIDGTVWPNQSQVFRQFGQAPVILDPESCRTPAALAVQGDEPVFWTLPTALAALCWWLNPAQTYVNNPLPEAFDVLPTWSLQNFRVARGKFLNEILDEILPRFGLTWRLDLTSGKPTIAFNARGIGTPNTVHLGVPGGFYSGDNAVDSHVNYDAGNVRNQAVVYGDWLHVEATFVLQKGWPVGLDGTAERSLQKDQFDPDGDALRDVWRTWVLNEAGDYIGSRPEITTPFDFSALFGTPTAPKRRKFLPNLTLDDNLAPLGETGGCQVEYSINGGTTWTPITSLEDRTCVILERECGIRFDGFFPPAELRRAGKNAAVRITATVRADIRLGTVIGPDGASPLAAVAPFLLDESAKFHWRVIDPSSRNYQFVDSGELESDQANDAAQLVDYATWLQDLFDIADVGGQLTVEGLDTIGTGGVYDLGQVITGITGRNVNFNAQSAASGELRFPQIVEIEYLPQEQRRVLRLETYRDTGAKR